MNSALQWLIGSSADVHSAVASTVFIPSATIGDGSSIVVAELSEAGSSADSPVVHCVSPDGVMPTGDVTTMSTSFRSLENSNDSAGPASTKVHTSAPSPYSSPVVGYVAETCEGSGHPNEDRYIAFERFGEESSDVIPLSLFAVYDGHCGQQTSQCLKEYLHTVLLPQDITYRLQHDHSLTDEDVENIILDGFAKAEEEVIRRSRATHNFSGAVCNLLLFRGSRLYCANLGDSRSILVTCRNPRSAPRPVALSHDHRPTLPEERARIEGAGGFISPDHRVNGILMCSRAFGDPRAAAKNKPRKANQRRPSKSPVFVAGPDVLSSIPEIKVHDIDWALDRYVVLATDGLWDSCPSKRVVRSPSVSSRVNSTQSRR